jgi:hypothetical protein
MRTDRARGTRTLGLSYLHTQLDLRVVDVDVDEALAFFEPHFTRATPSGPATARIHIHRRDRGEPPPEAEPVLIRKSRTEFFTVRAKRVGGRDSPGLACEASGTWLSFDLPHRRVTLDVPTTRPGREVIELIRSLVLRNEENTGVVMLHAAVVELDGRAVVVVGPKGAGKTSAALELVLHHGGRMLSGDKALLLPGDTLTVAGWPDWPHLGLGTISRFPILIKTFDLADDVAAAAAGGDIWSMDHKRPLDPATFRDVVPFAAPATPLPVAAFVFPMVGPDRPVSLAPCPSAERLAANVESSFASGTGGWNPLVEPSPHLDRYVSDAVARGATYPAFELEWDGALPPGVVSRLLGQR